MSVTIALAGNAMLGRGVTARITDEGPEAIFSEGVRDVFGTADLALLNLECCVTTRGRPWEGRDKRFHFRARPEAVRSLDSLGVDCVTLANNHALDFGYTGLSDTLEHLAQGGVSAAGAGASLDQARAPVLLEASGLRVAVVAVTDHPHDFAAGPDRPGVAYTEPGQSLPHWLTEQVSLLADGNDVVLVLGHWGPGTATGPLPGMRSAARELVNAGATLVAGHSAHSFHGVAGNVVYGLGDLVNDFPVDPALRNDLGLVFLVTVGAGRPPRVEAAPIKLEYGRTRLAEGSERDLILKRFSRACAGLGAEVGAADGRLLVGAVGQAD